jgi:hypothetical protein
MRYSSKRILLASATVLLAAGSAFAQPGYRRPSPIEQTLGDLDRVRNHAYADRHQIKHLDQARKDLLRFEDNWRRGKFDRDRLDSSIDHLNRIASSPQVNPRERDLLYHDVQALRNFRATNGSSFGYRGDRRY